MNGNGYSVRVKQQDLLAVVRRNRDNHRKVFEEAIEGYREEVIRRLEAMVADAKANRKIEVYVNLPRPEDHTADYDRVLAMIQMSVEETIVLDEPHFACYVLDEWGWRGKFLTDSASNSRGRTAINAVYTSPQSQ